MDYFRRFLIITLILVLSSCAVTKKKETKTTEATAKEQIIEKTVRKGDTVTFQIPNVVLKDTTIYTYNRVGTRIETSFDSEGKVDRVECIESALEQFTIINRELVESIKESKKDKELNGNTLIYVLGGVLMLFIVYILIRVETAVKATKML